MKINKNPCKSIKIWENLKKIKFPQMIRSHPGIEQEFFWLRAAGCPLGWFNIMTPDPQKP